MGIQTFKLTALLLAAVFLAEVGAKRREGGRRLIEVELKGHGADAPARNVKFTEKQLKNAKSARNYFGESLGAADRFLQKTDSETPDLTVSTAAEAKEFRSKMASLLGVEIVMKQKNE